MEKDVRNRKIVDLNNEGLSVREIAKQLNIGKSTVSNILNSVLIKNEKIPSKKVVEVKLKGDEEKFTNFSGWSRLNVNEYANDKTGEVIRIAFVRAKSKDECGYFVKLGAIGGQKLAEPVVVEEIVCTDSVIHKGEVIPESELEAQENIEKRIDLNKSNKD
jgi:transcriptional regulator with XRE-family HTH domain